MLFFLLSTTSIYVSKSKNKSRVQLRDKPNELSQLETSSDEQIETYDSFRETSRKYYSTTQYTQKIPSSLDLNDSTDIDEVENTINSSNENLSLTTFNNSLLMIETNSTFLEVNKSIHSENISIISSINHETSASNISMSSEFITSHLHNDSGDNLETTVDIESKNNTTNDRCGKCHVNGFCNDEGYCECNDNFFGDGIHCEDGIPTVLSVSPEEGPASGGTTVRITLDRLIPNLSHSYFCKFGSDVVRTNEKDENVLFCKTPPHLPGSAYVYISYDDSTYSYTDAKFKFIDTNENENISLINSRTILYICLCPITLSIVYLVYKFFNTGDKKGLIKSMLDTSELTPFLNPKDE